MIATFDSGDSGSRSVLRTAALPAVLLALCAAGCGVVRPTVSASRMQVGETADDATKVGIVLELTNPGRDEVELVRYDYAVVLDDGARYEGVWSAQRALPPGRTVEAVIPAVLPSASVGRASGASGGDGWRIEGTLRYRDPQSFARILYEAGILRTEVGFSGSGAVPSAASSARAPAVNP
ncbi:MAG: hypothetical protein GC172_07565 [Phycisphaera sp.]|nr:hypothetical protein [Phycisphaera sp.]